MLAVLNWLLAGQVFPQMLPTGRLEIRHQRDVMKASVRVSFAASMLVNYAKGTISAEPGCSERECFKRSARACHGERVGVAHLPYELAKLALALNGGLVA